MVATSKRWLLVNGRFRSFVVFRCQEYGVTEFCVSYRRIDVSLFSSYVVDIVSDYLGAMARVHIDFTVITLCIWLSFCRSLSVLVSVCLSDCSLCVRMHTCISVCVCVCVCTSACRLVCVCVCACMQYRYCSVVRIKEHQSANQCVEKCLDEMRWFAGGYCRYMNWSLMR